MIVLASKIQRTFINRGLGQHKTSNSLPDYDKSNDPEIVIKRRLQFHDVSLTRPFLTAKV